MARFGNLIEKCRLEADKTPDSVANLLGVSAAYVSEVELGKKPPFNRARIEQPQFSDPAFVQTYTLTDLS